MEKKSRIVIVFIFIGIIISALFFWQFQKESPIYDKEIRLKIGEQVPTEIEYQLGKRKLKATLKWNELELENGSIYYTGVYKGNFNIEGKQQKIILTVIDDIAPIIEGVKDIEIYENEEIDLLSKIKTSDNSHDKVSIEVKGQYDLTKKGVYLLTYEAKDKSLNITTKKFTLTVKEKGVSGQTSNQSITVGTTSKGYKIENKNGVYYINNILIANKTYALPNTYAPGLLQELNNAFKQLKEAAKKDGINLTIISGFRSFDDQNRIYNNYVKKDGKIQADTYSARPGHSEHQTGLAIDLNSLMFDFGETAEGKWIQDNVYKYGFIIRYPKEKEQITGYRYEPWHIRYVGELSKELYNNGDWITLEEYLGITSQYET